MLSNEEIQAGYRQRFQAEISAENLVGFHRLCEQFGCGDAGTFDEAYERIQAGIALQMKASTERAMKPPPNS